MQNPKHTLYLILLMTLLLPCHSVLAVSGSSPLYTHFVYMFGHANIFHLALNAFLLLRLANLYNPRRCLAAYITAVAISFIPAHSPVLGASVFLFFFFGMLLQWMWHRNKTMLLQVAAYIAAAFFFVNIAAEHHLLMFIAGFLFRQVERIYYFLTD